MINRGRGERHCRSIQIGYYSNSVLTAKQAFFCKNSMQFFGKPLFLISPGYDRPGANLLEQKGLLADILQRDALRFHQDTNAVEVLIIDRTYCIPSVKVFGADRLFTFLAGI